MNDVIYYIRDYEFYLLPIYIIVILLVAGKIASIYKYDRLTKFFFFAGLIVKLLGCITFALMQQYFFKEGDSFMYFSSGLDILQEVGDNFSSGVRLYFLNAEDFGRFYESHFTNTNNYGYMSSTRNVFVAKISSILSIPGLKGYLLTTLFFGLISFTGLWRMFLLFKSLYPSLVKELSLGFLFMPSVFFFGSAILKDPICLGAVGWVFTSFYYYFIAKQKSIQHIVIMVIGLYFLFNIKSYIAACMAIVLVLWILMRLITYKKKVNVWATAGLVIFLITTIALSRSFIESVVNDQLLETFTEYINESKKQYEIMGSEQSLITNINVTNPTMNDLISNVPNALLNTLYRPFIWESRSPSMVFVALENFCFLLFTAYLIIRRGPITILKRVFSSQMLIVCLLFTLIFASFIGLTCFNFGTTVRYRLPCIPFFYLTMLLLFKNTVSPKTL